MYYSKYEYIFKFRIKIYLLFKKKKKKIISIRIRFRKTRYQFITSQLNVKLHKTRTITYYKTILTSFFFIYRYIVLYIFCTNSDIFSGSYTHNKFDGKINRN